jgi:DNA-binding GntR family transcriptional regulator
MATKSLKQQAYEHISELILEETLAPGDPLVESDLAERLGISRTPVREALHRLEQDGLVEMLPRRGSFVARLSLRDLEELFELREATEGMAARLAALRGDVGELSRLQAEFAEADREPDPERRNARYEEIGEALHDYTLRTSGNRRLQKIADSFRIQIQKERRVAASIPGRKEQSMIEHRDVLAALLRRDPEAAEKLMRKHIVSTHDSVVELFKRSF